MFTSLTPSELAAVLSHYNNRDNENDEDVYISADEEKGIIFTSLHPSKMVFPAQKYYFDPNNGLIRGFDGSQYIVRMK